MVQTQDEIVASAEETGQTFGLLLASMAGISVNTRAAAEEGAGAFGGCDTMSWK